MGTRIPCELSSNSTRWSLSFKKMKRKEKKLNEEKSKDYKNNNAQFIAIWSFIVKIAEEKWS